MRWPPRWQWQEVEGGSVTQWRRAFAWLPAFVGGEWVWLEPYERKLVSWGWGFIDEHRRLVRDRDGTRSAETACPAPVPQDCQARADRHRQTPSATTPIIQDEETQS